MAGAATKPEISEASIALLRELAIIPERVGYDHRIRELDEHEPPLIEWLPRHGYTASHAGHEFLKALDARAQPTTAAEIMDVIRGPRWITRSEAIALIEQYAAVAAAEAAIRVTDEAYGKCLAVSAAALSMPLVAARPERAVG